MAKYKEEIKNNKKIHFSIGALIQKGDKFLLIDRVEPPFGFAGIAGHIDEGENENEALIREVKEESNLDILSSKLIFEEEVLWNWCGRGGDSHYWYLFKCEITGEMKQEKDEEKSIGWYSIEEIKKLKLEPVWEYWFKKLNLI